jgi:hypothetical protein
MAKLSLSRSDPAETLAALGLEKHPDKTYIGRVAKGFDFLGYRLSPKGLAVAPQTRERFAARAARLQRAGRKPPGTLGAYVRRWWRWTQAGLLVLRLTPGFGVLDGGRARPA